MPATLPFSKRTAKTRRSIRSSRRKGLYYQYVLCVGYVRISLVFYVVLIAPMIEILNGYKSLLYLLNERNLARLRDTERVFSIRIYAVRDIPFLSHEPSLYSVSYALTPYSGVRIMASAGVDLIAA
jgi:hypothetical protein